jgi:hypothetical protein
MNKNYKIDFYIAMLFFFISALPKALEITLNLTNIITTEATSGWSEVMINYNAGFVRRGLMGHFLYYLSNFINIATFYPLFLLTIYSFVWCFIIYHLTKAVNIYYSLLCILSPAILIFPVYQYGNYFRRDIFVILFIISSMYIFTQKLISRQKISLYTLTTAFCINYFISYLIAEITLFFMPIAAIPLGICYYKANKFKIWIILMCFLGFISIIISFLASLDVDIMTIVKSFPLEICDSYATVAALNLPIESGFNLVIKCWKEYNKVIISLPILIALAFCPIIFIYRKYKIFYIIKNIIPNKYIKILFIFCLLCPFLLFVIGVDYGRYIYMISTIYIFLLSMILYIDKYNNFYS